MERITKLELEVSKLCTELTEAKYTTQQCEPVRQNTLAVDTQSIQANKQDDNQIPKVRGMSQEPRQDPRFADLAALLSTKPGGQEWQEVTKKKQKNQQIQATAVATQPNPITLKPAKDSPKEAQRLLFHCEGGKAAPRTEKEDVILAINQAVAKEHFPAFI